LSKTRTSHEHEHSNDSDDDDDDDDEGRINFSVALSPKTTRTQLQHCELNISEYL